jgi:uncharacterized protein (DUF1499 family)
VARRALILVFVLGVLWAIMAFPRLNDVETGRTPAYPDLKVRDYKASVETVAKSATAVVGRLPRWKYVAAGTGPRGAELQAVHETRVFHFQDDVTVRIWPERGRTHVSVRSKSRVGVWDFGQNARNIQEFLSALDAQLP